MANKARPGKIRSRSGAKKRIKVTGKNRFAHQKGSHNHLLQQKSKKQKRLARRTLIANGCFTKQLKRMLPGK